MPNPKAEALKVAVNRIIDQWADELLASFQGKGPNIAKPRGLWDRIKSGFYGLFKGDTKENPYYYKNRFGDYLGANESVSPICLHDYLHLKSVVEETERNIFVLLNEDSMEGLRLFRIVRQAAGDLKKQIRDAINTIATPMSKPPVPPSSSSSSIPDLSSSSSSVAASVPVIQPAAASSPTATTQTAPASSPTAAASAGSSSSSSKKKRTGPVTPPQSKKTTAENPKSNSEPEDHDEVPDDPRPSETHVKKQTAAMRLFLDFGKLNSESIEKFPGPSVTAPWFYSIAKIRDNMESLLDFKVAGVDLSDKLKENKRDEVMKNLTRTWRSEDKDKMISYLKNQFIDSFDVSEDELVRAIEEVAGGEPMPELSEESMKILNRN